MVAIDGELLDVLKLIKIARGDHSLADTIRGLTLNLSSQEKSRLKSELIKRWITESDNDE